MYKSPYHKIKKTGLWIRGVFAAIAAVLAVAHE
jgi:hypothetical protein